MPATAAARRIASTEAPAPRVKRPARRGKPRRSPAAGAASRKRHTGRSGRAKAAPTKSRATRPRSAARSRTRPVRSTGASPVGGQLIPLAVGRTAVVVRGLPELRLVHRMTQGQLWIAVLGTLLAGIVGLNVVSLSLGASSGRVAQQVEGLERQNSQLRARLATQLSDRRVREAAQQLGLFVPAPGDIRYLTAGEHYAAIAARRLGAGDFTVSTALAPVPAAPLTTAVPTTPLPPTPATTETAPAATPETTGTTTTPAPAAPPPAPPPTSAPTGGVSP